MEKFEIYKQTFRLFLNEDVPDKLIVSYLEHEDNDYQLQDFIGLHMKKELLKWSTAIGIMDAVDIMYNEAISNGNIK